MECNVAKNVWLDVSSFFKNCGIDLPINGTSIILGLDNSDICNNILLVLKYYIYVSKCKNTAPTLYGGLEFLKYHIFIEKTSTLFTTPTMKCYIKRKWENLEAVLSG